MANQKTRSTEVLGVGEFRSTTMVQTGLVLLQKKGVKPVQYAVVDGLAIVEGDIVLGTEQSMADQTERLRAAQAGTLTEGVVISGAQFRWPGCTIPYDIDAGLTQQNRVTDAIAHWQQHTSFRFVQRTAANSAQYQDWVTFRPSSGCSSQVGRRGGQQFVNLGTGCTVGNVIHEIGHVVGLWHEQSREDRDTFVTIHWDKIQPGLEHNFDQHLTDGDDVGAYDYGSIMHYPRDAFSVDGSDTITPVAAGAQIGQRAALSAGDVAAAQSLCGGGTQPTIKEIPKDPLRDTVKERVKDLRLDTKKEMIVDTRKEMIGDTVKESPRDTVKEVALDPMKRAGGDVIQPGGGAVVNPAGLPGGAVPFAVGTVHHAPAAGAPAAGGADDLATQIDIQLQALAEGIAQAEATAKAYQRQYDELSALLKGTLDAADPEPG